MLSLVFSTLLDIPTLGLFILFAAVVAGWAFSVPLALMALLAMIVFYVQVIAVSQLVLALLMRVLQSRRFRDLSIVLIGVFFSSCYLFQQLVLRGLGNNNFYNGLKQAHFSPYLQWLPPGMAARSIEQASVGHWGASFGWLAALLVVSGALLYLWQIVVERALSTPETGGGGSRTRRRRSEAGVVAGTQAAAPTSTGLLAGILSSQVVALAIKDIKYYRRDPQLLRLIIQTLISIIVLIVVTLFNPANTARGAAVGPWAVMLAPAYALFALFSLSYNVLGMERESLTTLFLFPVAPRRILWGKNLVVFVIGGIEMLLLVCIVAFASHGWSYVLPAIVVGLAGICIVIGCGNFSSVFFPQRMPQMRRGFQGNTNLSMEGGCLRSVMSMVVLLITAVVLIPVVLALILPVVFHVQSLWLLSMPLSLLYGAGFYVIVTNVVAPRILEKEPEILAVVARE